MLQNAIRIKATGEILYSRHRHDLQESECGRYFVDGGHDYQRIGGNLDHIEELHINEDHSMKIKILRTLWGTYGKKGDQPLKWVFLRRCETEHLQNILKQRPLLWIEKVIREILRQRGERC